ncbi:type II toxin-antitoxin system RelE/ParE family toxin [Streptomyces thermolilacinus]|uniref:type II toxin-antitoxin system RelE/ParE family toxin n=1 Tax=Streptomyces thermolilacinus TaxID=285540 RepID=UPI0033D3ECD6
MRVEWLRTVLKNLDDEASCIAVDNPRAAIEFDKIIKASVEQLSQCSAMGREGWQGWHPRVAIA